jgi:sulfatase maturation enzyme AslB (radical SAM superfamily)
VVTPILFTLLLILYLIGFFFGTSVWNLLKVSKDNRYNRVMKIEFSSKDCMQCPSRNLCIRSKRRWKRRSITNERADGHQQALEAARKREKGPGFAAAYARRPA